MIVHLLIIGVVIGFLALLVKAAKTKTVHDDVQAIIQKFEGPRKDLVAAVSQTVQDEKAAVEQIAKHNDEVSALQATRAKAQTLLNGLSSLGDGK